MRLHTPAQKAASEAILTTASHLAAAQLQDPPAKDARGLGGAARWPGPVARPGRRAAGLARLLLAALAALFAGADAARATDPSWCDQDRDGYCARPFGMDCDDADSQVNPDATEIADLKDGDCDGFADEPPLGLALAGQSGAGFAGAVRWRGDYLYAAAGAQLQVYHAPPGARPAVLGHIELGDWIRKIELSGDTLFVAARGDGLLAFDVGADPGRPQLVARVSGLVDAPAHPGIEAVFNGLDAKGSRVAVAVANAAARFEGGVDALVLDWDAAGRHFTAVWALSAASRANSAREVPLSVGLSEDGTGLYVGYGVVSGELTYALVGRPDAEALHWTGGAAMDLATRGSDAFVAVTKADLPGAACSMLSRFRVAAGSLVEQPILQKPGSSAGNAVHVDGGLLCFGIWGPGRLEPGQVNLWMYTDLDASPPTRLAAAGTIDWIYQLGCRDAAAGARWAAVADEWGGLELWKQDGSSLTLDLQQHRVATGMYSLGLAASGSRIYSVKEGAGLWMADTADLQGARPVVEWIERTDPGCQCAGCCPPETGARPFPPGVFVSGAAVTQGRVALLAQDRNTAVPQGGYFMVFERSAALGRHVCVYAEPVAAFSGTLVKPVSAEILVASDAAGALQVYQHCPQAAAGQQVRRLGKIDLGSSGADWWALDVAAAGDLLFVSQGRMPLLGAEPDAGRVDVYRWDPGSLPACPQQASPLPPPQRLGSFCTDLVPRRLLVDARRNRLVVGCTSKRTFPVKPGALLFYDLSTFDPDDPSAFDAQREDRSPPASMRVLPPNVHDVLLDATVLQVIDQDNGVYEYSLSQAQYVRFYPAHRGRMSQAFEPQLVHSPPEVRPLYEPIAAALGPAGELIVQEGVTGRVSILVRPAAPGALPGAAPWAVAAAVLAAGSLALRRRN